MASVTFQARTKFYFNSPYVIKRIGAKRAKVLARTGAYGRGVFRNKLGRPQLKQTKERTVFLDEDYIDRNGQLTHYTGVVFVPRRGMIVNMRSGFPVPREVAIIALDIVARRVRGQGAGKPPRRGESAKLRRHNEFYLDPRTDSVVIGTVPFPTSKAAKAASIPNQLDTGTIGRVEHPLLPPGGVLTAFTKHPYVNAVLPPTLNKMGELIETVRL